MESRRGMRFLRRRILFGARAKGGLGLTLPLGGFLSVGARAMWRGSRFRDGNVRVIGNPKFQIVKNC